MTTLLVEVVNGFLLAIRLVKKGGTYSILTHVIFSSLEMSHFMRAFFHTLIMKLQFLSLPY